MLPSAHIAAVIELVEKIYPLLEKSQSQPVDQLLGQYFKARRFIGAKDRGVIATAVYGILRSKSALEWWVERCKRPLTPRSIVLTYQLVAENRSAGSLMALYNGMQYSPMELNTLEEKLVRMLEGKSLHHDDQPNAVRFNIPRWLVDPLRARFGEEMPEAMAALNAEAATDLRVNTLKAKREKVKDLLDSEGLPCTLTPLSPWGLRLNKRGAIFATKAFRDGFFEVQDEGSQLLAMLVDAQPGHKVIDFCAGAGGKTLAMAAMMQNKGRILAWDVSEKRLAQISPRIKRAGVDNIQIHAIANESDSFIKRHKNTADRVLVDAPCSGSGTWRRNPDLKWKLTTASLAELINIQQRILDSAARLVKPGGILVYATCSLLESENESQVERFLKMQDDFSVVSVEKVWNKHGHQNGAVNNKSDLYHRTAPHKDGTDGFFAALLMKSEDAHSEEKVPSPIAPQ